MGRRFDEGLAHGREAGDRLGIYNALFSLAQLALSLGEYDEAIRRFTEGIQPSQEMGDLLNVAYILEGLGVVAGLRDQAHRAAKLLGASEGLIEAAGLRGHTSYVPDRSLYEGLRLQCTQRLARRLRPHEPRDKRWPSSRRWRTHSSGKTMLQMTEDISASKLPYMME